MRNSEAVKAYLRQHGYVERETRSGGGGAAFANPTDRIVGSEEEFVGSDEARPSSSVAPGAGGGVGDGGRREKRERGERERERGVGIVSCAPV